MNGLTKRQLDIFNFIQEFIESNRYSPSYREIKQHFGFCSLGSVYKFLNILKRKGMISAEKQCSRSLTLTKKPSTEQPAKETKLPFVGYIAAGSPIELFSQSQTLVVPEFLVQTPDITYILKARGESLHEELIADGDLLLVEARQDVQPGETIVALINNHDIIVKRYFSEGDYVHLTGHNSHHHPIILRCSDILIQGVVVGLIRSYS